ncbi:MAG: respiratory nitrate reductase subunit gamma [Thermoguttaceae bacterium]
MLSFVAHFLPYASVAVFVAGMAWRNWDWLSRPVLMPLALREGPSGPGSRAAATAWELAFFPSLFRGDRRLWLAAWAMHAALALILVGHVFGIATLATQFTWLGLSVDASERLSMSIGRTAGLLLALALLALLIRRGWSPVARRLSRPGEYFDLALLLAIAVSGLAMRSTRAGTDLVDVRAYLAGLAMFRPAPFPHDALFLLHFLLVNALLLYFPFSKLVHLSGAVVARWLLLEPAPSYPTPAGARGPTALLGDGRKGP